MSLRDWFTRDNIVSRIFVIVAAAGIVALASIAWRIWFGASPVPSNTAAPTSEVPSSSYSGPPSTMLAQSAKLEPAWQVLQGAMGASERWGSGWLDLNAPQGFQKGTELRLQVGGTAKTIAVRLLRVGRAPDDATGVVGQYDVPADGWVKVKLSADYDNINQISVHGQHAWGIWGSDQNGPATFLKAEVKPPSTL